MIHGYEKSDPAIVAAKPANKANEPTLEASVGANASEPVSQISDHWPVQGYPAHFFRGNAASRTPPILRDNLSRGPLRSDW